MGVVGLVGYCTKKVENHWLRFCKFLLSQFRP